MGVRGPNAFPLGGQLKVASLKRLPPAPRTLTPSAAAAWRECGLRSIELGTLSKADLTGLELLARTLAGVAELEAQLARDGMVLESESGARKAHPALNSLNSARAQARALLNDFGLLPSGRDKLRNVTRTDSRRPLWVK